MLTRCPEPAKLAWIKRGAADGSCPPEMAEHIEDCPLCQKRLERCAGGLDSLTLRTDGPKAGDPLPRIEGFTIERELGRGATGVVYLAHRDLPRRPVALKILPGGRRAGQQERRSWLREAEAASAVRHPNIVTLHEACVADDWFLLVLEYVPGGTLADQLAGNAGQSLSPRTAARMTEIIARAVHHIHQSGLLHLDLKPSNILLDGDAGTGWDGLVPKVTDFGIARAADSSATYTGGVGPGGTPSYMAPEQISRQRKKMTVQADIHGLGAILYHMLTGRPPYHGATILETIDQLQREGPAPTRRWNPKTPCDLETICLKCLEKDPVRRYASADALASDLRRWLDGRPIAARPVSAAEKTWRWCRRRPAIALLIAALAVLLVGGFAGPLILWRISETARARVQVEHAKAETARQLAEENERLGTRTLDELSGILGFALGHPEAISKDRLSGLAHFLIQQTSHSRNYRGVGHWYVPGSGVLQRMLAVKLFESGQRSEARSLIAESAAYLTECRRVDPDDQNTLWQLGQSFLHAGHLAASDLAVDDALTFYHQASSLSGALTSASYRLELINELYSARRRLAIVLIDRGESERARQLLIAARRSFLDTNEGPDAGHLDRPLSSRRTPDDLDTAGRAIERLRAVLRNSAEDRRLPRAVECYVANVLSSVIAPVSIDAALVEESRYEIDPDAWSESLVSMVRSPRRSLGLDERAIPAIAMETAEMVASTAALQRRIGRLEEAEATAGRLMAFARQVVRDYPDHPESYMVLSEAHFQVSKNAWKRLDYTTIERALRQSLESASHARDLDPRHAGARLFVERIIPRLAMFDAGRARPTF